MPQGSSITKLLVHVSSSVDSGRLGLVDCDLVDNSAGMVGGGLAMLDVSAVTIRESRIVSNTAKNGGGGGLAVLQVGSLLRNQS
jgi:hypothetical protein